MLSLVPGDQLPVLKIEWVSADTLAHLVMYGVLAILMLFGFEKSFAAKHEIKMNLFNIRLYIAVILTGIILGYLIELVQGNFIYGRFYDTKDVIVNIFGTIFGVSFYRWIGRKLIKI